MSRGARLAVCLLAWSVAWQLLGYVVGWGEPGKVFALGTSITLIAVVIVVMARDA